jgi:hypothetical protein
LGWRGFCSLEGIALKFICTADHFSWARGKAVIWFLYLCGTLHIKITLRAKTSTVIVLAILKLHLCLFEDHGGFGSGAINAGPGRIGISVAAWYGQEHQNGTRG